MQLEQYFGDDISSVVSQQSGRSRNAVVDAEEVLLVRKVKKKKPSKTAVLKSRDQSRENIIKVSKHPSVFLYFVGAKIVRRASRTDS